MKRFKLLVLEIDTKDIEKIQKARSGTIDAETMTVCDGLADEKGYFIPAIKVYWPDSPIIEPSRELPITRQCL